MKRLTDSFGFREDSRHSHAKLEEEDDGNNSFCSECGAGGTLACCDSCKGAIHVKCLKRASPTAAAAFDTALADGTLWMCQGCATYSSQEEQIVAYQAAADAALKEEDLRPFLLDAAEQVSVALGLELDEDGVEEMADLVAGMLEEGVLSQQRAAHAQFMLEEKPVKLLMPARLCRMPVTLTEGRARRNGSSATYVIKKEELNDVKRCCRIDS